MSAPRREAVVAEPWHQPESWHTLTTAAGTFETILGLELTPKFGSFVVKADISQPPGPLRSAFA